MLPPYFTVLALSALTAGAALAVMLRMARTVCTLPGMEGALPAWLRWTWRPSAMFAASCACLCPPRWRNALARKLVSADLDPVLLPERWLAMRAIMGLCCALAILLGCGMAGVEPWIPVTIAAGAGVAAPAMWLGRFLAQRGRRIDRELPAYLDLLIVSVEAGAALAAGVRLIVERSPQGPLRGYFERVLREIRGGRTRAEAFSLVAEQYAVPALSALATALAHGEAAGMSLGNVLRAQSAQRTTERFAAAEKLAMQAPVKLLGPLILCIFPCTFIVLAVPIIVRLREAFAS